MEELLIGGDIPGALLLVEEMSRDDKLKLHLIKQAFAGYTTHSRDKIPL